MSRLLHVVVALALAAAPAPAQDEPAVGARLGAAILRLGDVTRLRVQVDGAERAEMLALPTVEGVGLGPADGPSHSIQDFRDLVTGERTVQRTATWIVHVSADAIGEFEIPPLALLVDGERRTTQSFSLLVVEDLEGQDLGLLAVVPSSRRVVEGQPFTLEVRVGWDAALGSEINFARLSAPWWDDLPGTIDVELPRDPGGDWHEVGLNNGARLPVVVTPSVEAGGRSFVQMVARRGLIASRPGTLELDGTMLEFGRVVERGGFIQRRQEVVKNYFTRADPVTIEVVQLPEEGRPFEWSGAVGTVEARADADVRDVVEGESIQLVVEWTGEANLEFFRPPDPARVEAFADFRVYGTLDEKLPGRRRVTYDLAPATADVTAIPALPLAVFDPERMEYVEVSTAPIPIHVRSLGGTGLADEEEAWVPAEDVSDIRTGALAAGGGVAPGLRGLLLALGGFGVAWLVLRGLVRARRGDPDAPLERRRRRARRELDRALRRAQSPAEELAALHAYLAALSREPAQAWVGREPRRWFREHRPEALEAGGAHVDALEELLGRLERAAFGGADERPPAGEVLHVADALRGGVL